MKQKYRGKKEEKKRGGGDTDGRTTTPQTLKKSHKCKPDMKKIKNLEKLVQLGKYPIGRGLLSLADVGTGFC